MLRSTALVALATAFAFAQTPPRVIKKPVEPQCSDKAIRDHISGLVKLRAVVGTDGHVRDVEIVRGVGWGLNESAVEAVRTWEFKPGTKDGAPVEATAPIEIDFRCSNGK